MKQEEVQESNTISLRTYRLLWMVISWEVWILARCKAMKTNVLAIISASQRPTSRAFGLSCQSLAEFSGSCCLTVGDAVPTLWKHTRQKYDEPFNGKLQHTCLLFLLFSIVLWPSPPSNISWKTLRRTDSCSILSPPSLSLSLYIYIYTGCFLK